jgi:hypothetical protein
MQVNNISPQKLLGGLNEARDDAIHNLKFIDEIRRSNITISIKPEMRLKIF